MIQSNTCQVRSSIKKDASSPIINFISHIHLDISPCCFFSTKCLSPPVHKIGNTHLMTDYIIFLCTSHHFYSLLNFQNVFWRHNYKVTVLNAGKHYLGINLWACSEDPQSNWNQYVSSSWVWISFTSSQLGPHSIWCVLTESSQVLSEIKVSCCCSMSKWKASNLQA